MNAPLVLSLFPGIGLLDMASEEEGFCVVRGPDLLWGGDVRRFHPPAGKFDGVIGGPPCQAHSRMANIARHRWGPECVAPDLIPEFARCVREAAPRWFLMENVEGAPLPVGTGLSVWSTLFNNRWLGEEQNRLRRLTFGSRDGRRLRFTVAALEHVNFEPAVLCGKGAAVSVAIGGSGKPKRATRRTTRTFADALRLQGLPADFLERAPFTATGKQRVVGNGVPLPMGRAIARAVKRAVYPELTEVSA